MIIGSIEEHGESFADSRRAVGILASGSEIFVTEVEYAGGRCQVRRAVQKRYEPAADMEAAQQLAEDVKMICLTHGIGCQAMRLIYQKSEVFWYVKRFPPMPEHDLAAAIKLDLTVNCPYHEGEFLFGYAPLAAGEFMIAALDAAHGANVVNSFQALDMNLAAIFLAPESFSYEYDGSDLSMGQRHFALLPAAVGAPWTEAQALSLYAADQAAASTGGALNFLPQGLGAARKRWLFLGKMLAFAWLLLLMGLYGIDAWRIYRLDQRLEELSPRWESKLAERQRVGRLQRMEAELAEADRILVRLSAERHSWYYIFYILGALTFEDVYLDGLEMKEDKFLYCTGFAGGYESLVGFLQLLEDHRELFQEMPVLENFTAKDEGGFAFTIRLKFF